MFEVRIFTLYPDLYPGPLNIGIYKKAQEEKIWNLKVINIRDYATDKHNSVDDTPFGGGNGRLLRPDVVASAQDSNLEINETTNYIIDKDPLNPEQAKIVSEGHWIPLLSLPKYLQINPLKKLILLLKKLDII